VRAGKRTASSSRADSLPSRDQRSTKPAVGAQTERALGADEEPYSCTVTIPDDAIAPVSAPNAGFVVGAAGFEREAENAETLEKEACSGSEAVAETPIGGRSRGPEADLAHAMRLAAEAGQWVLVADLSRQLDALRRHRERG